MYPILAVATGRAATFSEPLPDVPTPPRFDSVPDSLRDVPAWVVWAFGGNRHKSGKYPKRPFNPRTDNPADTTDRATWGTFRDARDAFQRSNGGYDGIGFVFAADGSHAGLDLDGCRDPQTGELVAPAARLLADLDTYTEASPSGRGVKAFAVGRLDPDGPKRSGGVELYDRGRFFAVTGHRLHYLPAEVRPAGPTLARLQDSMRLTPAERKQTNRTDRGREATEPNPVMGRDEADALLTRMSGAANGDSILRYYHGDRQGKPSVSEALLGLAQLSAFWIGPYPNRLEAFLRTSQLWAEAEFERAKWDSPRGEWSWGFRYVVLKAIDTCGAFHPDNRFGGRVVNITGVRRRLGQWRPPRRGTTPAPAGSRPGGGHAATAARPR